MQLKHLWLNGFVACGVFTKLLFQYVFPVLIKKLYKPRVHKELIHSTTSRGLGKTSSLLVIIYV